MERGEVAGQGGGVAGDVDQAGGAHALEDLAGLGADPGAGWIEDDKVGAVAVKDGAVEEVECGRLDDRAGGRLLVEGGAEVAGGGGIGLDCRDFA